MRTAEAVRSATRPVVITPMRRRHLRSVLRIEERTSSTPWSTVVGYVGLLFSLTDGHVTTVAVDPDLHNERIGTRLLLVAFREAIARGAEAITLEVRASNEPALALYRRFGFAPAGTRRGYYRHPDEDALVLWAHDVNTEAYAERLDSIERSLPTPLLVEGLTATPVAPPAGHEPTEGPN